MEEKVPGYAFIDFFVVPFAHPAHQKEGKIVVLMEMPVYAPLVIHRVR
jgi:hypothetical protein